MSNYKEDDWIINISLYSIENIEVVKQNSKFVNNSYFYDFILR